jgi:hypothetical protein
VVKKSALQISDWFRPFLEFLLQMVSVFNRIWVCVFAMLLRFRNVAYVHMYVDAIKHVVTCCTFDVWSGWLDVFAKKTRPICSPTLFCENLYITCTEAKSSPNIWSTFVM